MNEAIIIFGSGDNQLPFIKESQSRGFVTIVFDQDNTKIGALEADLFFPISIHCPNDIIKKLGELELNYKAIIARVTSRDALMSAHLVAEKYGLNFPSKQLIKLGTDKSYLMDFCDSQQIQKPITIVARDRKELDGKLNVDAVYIIKPARTKVGKESIFKCEGAQSVHQHFTDAIESSANKTALIQDFVPGHDMTVLTHFHNGQFDVLASWDEIIAVDQAGGIRGIGLKVPSNLEENCSVKSEIKAILEKFGRILIEDNYLIAFSFRITECGPYLIEVHIDLTGDLIGDRLLPAASTGFDFFRLATDILLKIEPQRTSNFESTIFLNEERQCVRWSETYTYSYLEALKIREEYKEISYMDSIKPKSIIQIGAGELQRESINSAKKHGLYVIGTDIDPEAKGVQDVDEYHKLSGADDLGLTNLALKKSKDLNIVGAYASSDFALRSVANIHAKLGLKGPSRQSVITALDKYKSKQIWIQKQVLTPHAQLVRSGDKIDYEIISYPVIVKPKDSSGSQGVSTAHSMRDLETKLAHALSFSDSALIETLVNGKHYDTIGVIWEGRFIPMGIGNRYFSPDPYHFPLWGHAPSDLNESEIKQAYKATADAALALGLDNTPVKADLILSNDQFYVIEVAPRFHGDVFSAKMIPYSTGIDPIFNLFSLYLGHAVETEPKFERKIIWKGIFPKQKLIGEEWLQNRIPYKDLFLNGRQQKSFTHTDNSSIAGFIWFETPEELSFQAHYKAIQQELGDFIL